MEQNYTKIDHELPLIPLRGLAIFPYMILNFDIGREMSLKALDQAMLEDELVFLTSQKEAEVDDPTTEDFYHVGTICKVKQVIKLPGETVRVLVEGISRGKVKEINEDEGYFKASVEEIIEKSENKISDCIYHELDLIGVNSKLKGREYIHDAILYLIQNENSNISVIQYLTKVYKKSATTITNGIQNAIIHAWRVTAIEDLTTYYTARVNYETGIPTTMEFLYYYRDKIKKMI